LSLVEASDVLRDARERRGESLEEVAESTGIRQRYLEELEEGDASFEPYPGRVYGRFFLREYAEHLGLDPAPMVEAFDGEAGPDRALEPSGGGIRTSRRSLPDALVALICVVAVVIAAAIFRGGRGSPSEPGATRVSAASLRSDLKPPFAATRPPADRERLEGIRAVVDVSGGCWIEAISDGKTIYRATAPEGAVVRLRADRRLELTLGNAGGVDLVVNGRPTPTGSTSEVIHLMFELRAGEVVSSAS